MPNKFLVFILVLSVSWNLAFAMKIQGHPAATVVEKKAPYSEQIFSFLTEKQEKIINNLKVSSSKRRPANELNVKPGKVKALHDVVEQLHKLKTSEEIQDYINKLNANYDKYPTDVKFYIATITPFSAFRGAFYRLRTLFENNSEFIHSQVLTFAKRMATLSGVYLPYEHVDALYEYISSPYLVDGKNEVEVFQSELDIQVWQVKELLPQLVQSINRLEKLDLVDPVIWDQRIVHGPKSFQDDIGRYKQIGEFEKSLMIATLYSGVSSICVNRSYNVNNSIDLAKKIGKVYGLDGFGFNRVDGVSAKKVTGVINKSKFRETGTLLSDGKSWMMKALEANRKAVERVKIAWNYSAEIRNQENFYVFNIGYLNINRDEIEQNLEIMDRVINSSGVESLRSSVTGEIIQINYSQLFINPPKDLKSFLPNKFEEGKNRQRVVSFEKGGSKTLVYRNYSEGRPTGWNLGAYKAYFPSVGQNTDINLVLRVLSHAGGNWLGIQ